MIVNKKILLVFPGAFASKVQKKILVNLPLSVLQLAAYIMERGYQVKVFDMRIQDINEIKNEIKDFSIIGFSCMTGLQIKYGLEFAKYVRQINDKVQFIWGGVHPTLFPEESLKNPLVDFIVKGEGEESLYELLETLCNGKTANIDDIKGIGYKQNGLPKVNADREFLDMEQLPLAAYQLVDITRYPNILTAFDYQSSRGCPFRCAFCYNTAFNKRKYRAKSPEKVVDELSNLCNKFNVKKFSFNDDEFFINKNRVEKICSLIIEKNLKIEWNASCRLDIIRKYPDPLMKLIRESGCKNLNFGAESGSPEILKKITKDITTEDILLGAKHTIDNGIIPYMSFMGGFPGETIEDTLKTKEIITELKKINPHILSNGIFIFNPYPGTPLYEEAIKLGANLPDTFEGWGNYIFKYDADLPWVSVKHKKILKLLFYMVRFNFYLHELSFRPGYSNSFRLFAKTLLSPWILSAKIRWKFNFFILPVEWYLWALLMRKTFGFL